MREIILDTETTGLDPYDGHRVIEIGCIELVNRIKTGKFYQVYINPERDVPKAAFEVHGISYEFLKDKRLFKEIAQEFVDFITNATLVIHNAKFDLKFLNKELITIGFEDLSKIEVIDTLDVSRRKFPGSPASLDALCKRFKVDLSKRENHGALLDAELLTEVYIHLTGGNQTKLELTQSKDNEVLSLIKLPKQFKEPRLFEPSKEEIANHDGVVAKLKKPIWCS